MKSRAYIKHFMHHARDLPITYEIDLIQRRISLEVDWIDTLLLQRFLSTDLLEAIHRELAQANKLPLPENLSGFEITLSIAGTTSFDLQLVERDFEPRETTLIMKAKE